MKLKSIAPWFLAGALTLVGGYAGVRHVTRPNNHQIPEEFMVGLGDVNGGEWRHEVTIKPGEQFSIYYRAVNNEGFERLAIYECDKGACDMSNRKWINGLSIRRGPDKAGEYTFEMTGKNKRGEEKRDIATLIVAD
jgi:hypothetical protein